MLRKCFLKNIQLHEYDLFGDIVEKQGEKKMELFFHDIYPVFPQPLEKFLKDTQII